MKKRLMRSVLLAMITALIVSMMPLTVSAASKAPGKTKITSYKVGKISKKNSTTTVTIKWKKAKKATGYIVYEKLGDGKWVKLKKVGKKYTKMTIKNVPTGQYSLRIQAIRKHKGKTYNGKLSAVKTKFIKSPLTLEKMSNIKRGMKGYRVGKFVASYKGNRVIFTYDTTNDVGPIYTDADWQDLKATASASLNTFSNAAYWKNFFKKETGVANVSLTIRYVHSGKELASRNY